MSQDYKLLYDQLKIEFENSKNNYENIIKDNNNIIENLKNENEKYKNDLQSVQVKLKEKTTDLNFLAEQYSKMEEKLKILKSCNEELDNNNTTEEINKLLLIELEKMKKEEKNYLVKCLAEENFSFYYLPSKNIFHNFKRNSKYEHQLLSDNVDEILHNIQQKQEKLIMTQKMINENKNIHN